MNCSKGAIIPIVLFFSVLFSNTMAQTVRIMPMGNSITYDWDQADVTNPRDPGDCISYRYTLYQLLTAAGYTFDYTGSENAGNNYFQDAEMDDNAGFPGITDAGLASLLLTGINPTKGVQVSPGPYMESYPADIILLHIGTNDVDESPDDVEDILDIIRANDPDVVILVARIIDRATHSAITTTFNNNVQAMVEARNDDRIISVNMETGAGINYLYQMDDNIHPNVTSYNKMAAKWFEAIVNINTAPVITQIPRQTTNEGIAFEEINLDTYIADNEDADNQISWTYELKQGTNVSVVIDENRILHISPLDDDWSGNDTITLIAEDSGNGAFRIADTVHVALQVMPVNDPPVITSTPQEVTDEDVLYNYTITADDLDSGNELIYTALQLPLWLTFDPVLHILSGTPANENVGLNTAILQVSDGSASATQEISLVVNNTNDPPEITTQPLLSVRANNAYLYEIRALDNDIDDVLTYEVNSIPGWLNFSAGSLSGIIIGTPSQSDAGDHTIILQVSDGVSITHQQYTLTVIPLSAVENVDNSIVRLVYPNPVTDNIVFTLTRQSETTITILDLTGNLQKQVNADNLDRITISLVDLPDGIYIYKVLQRDKISMGKIVKN